MQLSDNERLFLEKRAKLVGSWTPIGILLLCVVIAFAAWLMVFQPMLGNPFFVIAQLETNSIAVSNLAAMAAILPLMTLMCVILTLVVVLLMFSALRNEKRHIDLIYRLVRESDQSRVDQ